MRKVVICALDLNVLSSYSLHEQRWETRLSTLKVSGLYHKKVKFPLKISDRAWWLEVLVLKHQGKLSRRKGNSSQDMEIDHVGTVRWSLSSKTCQTKTDVTEVDIEHKKPVETSEEKSSCIPYVSSFFRVQYQRVWTWRGFNLFWEMCWRSTLCLRREPRSTQREWEAFLLRLMSKKGNMMQVRTFLMMTVDMFPLHLQSQIRDLIGNRHQRDLEMWLMRELLQVQVIRMTRMIRTVRIRMILLNGTSQNWRETFCFNMRAEGTDSTTVGVTPACKLVGGHQLVDVNKRQKKVDRQLSTN